MEFSEKISRILNGILFEILGKLKGAVAPAAGARAADTLGAYLSGAAQSSPGAAQSNPAALQRSQSSPEQSQNL